MCQRFSRSGRGICKCVDADGAHRLYGDISTGKVNSWRSFPFYQYKLVLNIIVRFEGLCLGDSLIPFKCLLSFHSALFFEMHSESLCISNAKATFPCDL